tara:strand:+ start:633 stop:827 length:195 start_codon:yes stop_codon:yes gene_type:complete
MSKNKDLLIKELSDGTHTPSHLEKEMYEQVITMKKQIKAIQTILEGCNEKHTNDSNNNSSNRMS